MKKGQAMRLERRRDVLERRVALWKERVKENPDLQPQLEHAATQLARLDEKYDSPGKETGGE